MRFIAILLAATLALTACSTRKPINPPPSGTPTASVSADPELLTLTIRTDGSRNYIVDGTGRAVYIYGEDGDSEVSKCPDYLCHNDGHKPLLAPDNVKASFPLSDNLVGVSGSGQVMYNKHLLYYYTKDAYPSLTPMGTGVYFYLLNPQGNVIGIP